MKHNSWVLWLIGVACVGPVVLAAILYYGPWSRPPLPSLPGVRELVQPPIALPPSWFDEAEVGAAGRRYRWSLIYARIAACDQQCVEDLGRLRQVQLALGRDVDRVRRVYLYTGPDPQLSDDRLLLRRLDDQLGAPVLALLGEDRLRAGRVYIADPKGNLVVSYPASAEQKELLRDLQRLLAVSGTDG